MAFKKESKFKKKPGGRMSKGKFFSRNKFCKFCTGHAVMDYKEPNTLKSFMTDRGKILPGKVTGTCAKHQRRLAQCIKQSRMLALLPFSG